MTNKLDNSLNYWSQRWQDGRTQWDIGYPSPPLQSIIDQIQDKDISILIPGCGNAYELKYLVEKGFHNITVIDIVPDIIHQLAQEYNSDAIKFLCEDFFLHQGHYDLILEQTFFCAIPILERRHYVLQMYELLNPQGLLAGVLFNRQFSSPEPPYGGSMEEYLNLFQEKFQYLHFFPCTKSIPPRQGSELFFYCQKTN